MSASRYRVFDRSRLKLRPLSERQHDLDLSHWLRLEDAAPPFQGDTQQLRRLAARIRRAHDENRAVILMMGAHVLRAGVSRHVIDLMERGFLTHIAMNGAGAIHEYELARIGATTESVARYIATGEFGLWNETGILNDWIAASAGLGMGEAIGKRLLESGWPQTDLTLLAAGYRLGIPVTLHVGIGYDIIHEHPNCDGAATGAASYRDFLIFTHSVGALEGGVLLNFGSAVMGPEVYLKALAMARNVAHQEGRVIRNFATAVFDVYPMPRDFRKEPPKTDPSYYFRPYKTILVRTVAEGGESFYFQGDHRATVPALRQLLLS